MAQKVNPISLRLQQTNREFDNSWYTQYFYRRLVSRDIYLQQYINNFLKLIKYPSARFSIQYSTKNIKISSFICYPKQSREYRSRMFGIRFIKKRKNKYKNKWSTFLSNANQFSFFGSPLKMDNREPYISNISSKKNNNFGFFDKKTKIKHKKNTKFLLDNRLWSRIYNPFHSVLQNKNPLSIFLHSQNQRATESLLHALHEELNRSFSIKNGEYQLLFFNNMYNTILLRTYTNKNISTFKNFINKPGHFLWPYLSLGLFTNNINQKNPLVSVLSIFEKKIEQQKRINHNQSLNNSKNQLVDGFFYQVKKDVNFSILQNKKQIKHKKSNSLLYFVKNFVTTLVFIKNLRFFIKNGGFLHAEHVGATAKINKQNKNFLNFNIKYRNNFIKFFFIFSLLYTEYNRNSSCKALDLGNLKKDKSKLLNSLCFFSSFYPLSIFHTTLEKTPINYLLLSNNIHSFSLLKTNKKLLAGLFYNVKKKEQKKKQQQYTAAESMHLPLPINYSPFTMENHLNSGFITNNLSHIVKNKQMQQLKYKNYIQRFLGSQFNVNTEFLPFNVSQDWQSAGFLADEIVYFLERRVTFRRLKHKILKKITENTNIRGIRITCSGRVGGKSKKAQRAKMECVKYGQTSRHTFSSPIDFAVRTARTIFGSVGIKVWICYH